MLDPTKVTINESDYIEGSMVIFDGLTVLQGPTRSERDAEWLEACADVVKEFGLNEPVSDREQDSDVQEGSEYGN